MSKVSLPLLDRQCGDCHKCCEGRLEANIYEHKMHSGQACFFLQSDKTGCSIYPNRPKDPCMEYTCCWLDEPETFPGWMKPNLSNIIISKKTIKDTKIEYYEVVEAGSKIDSSILNWLVHWALRTGNNLIYEVEGKTYTLANAELGAALAAEK